MVISLSIALSATAFGANAPDAGPYRGIVERNVFNLKPPPPAVPPEPPAAPPPKVVLTGITTILGPKKALLRVSVPARPPEPAKEESYIMTEDERRGEIHVLKIDEKAGTVRLTNHGAEQTLDFKNDGAKQVAVALPPPPVAPGAIPPPVAAPLPPPAAGAPPQIRTIPTRQTRVSPAGANPGAAVGGASMTPAFGSAPMTPAFGAQNSSASAAQFGNNLSPDEQEILLAAQHLKATQDGNPVAPIIPVSPRMLQEMYPNGGAPGQPPVPAPQ